MSKRFFTPLDLTGTINDNVSTPERSLKWSDGTGTLELGLKGNNIKLPVGQEEVALCFNGSGATLNKGDVVYITGAQGQRPRINKASASSESTSSKTFGIVSETILTGQEGFVTTFGVVANINTSAFTEGSPLYLSTTAGGITNSVQTPPNHTVFIGYCLKSNQSSGRIFVKIQNGYEIQELHNVLINSPSTGHTLNYNSTTGLWTNGPASGGVFEVYYQSSAPSSPVLGDIWVDSDENLVEYDALDVSNILPSQSGNSGKFLTTNGSSPSWQTINLSIYAPLNAPTFTGIPTAPTAIAGTNTTQLATTEFVRSEVANLIASAPAALDTLDELAAALGDDANFATTVTNSIATKEPTISAGTTSQYWRGDKSWQTLNKTSVGLSNVENTSLSTWAGTSNITTVGNINSGTITLQSTAKIETTSTTINTNSTVSLSSLNASQYRSAEYLVQVVQGVKQTVSKLIMIHDGTNAHVTEYSLIELGASRIPITLAVNLTGGSVVLEATITDANITDAVAKVIQTAIVI